MDFEQKYKDALRRAKKLYGQGTITECLGWVFPELAESDSERIRKAIKSGIRHLETQLGYDAVDGVDILDIYSWLEKQGEQTHAELGQSVVTKTSDQELEPKFKVGDWISGYYTNYRVTAINSKGYVVDDTDGNKIIILFENEKFHHLWTIQDAKDGDVLCYHVSATNFFQIAIFKRVASKDELWGQTYRNYVQYGGFGGIENYTLQVALGDNELHHCGATACPATKEQRDLLFAKMKEVGYEWNVKKKELNKIEQNAVSNIEPKFHPGDWIIDNVGNTYQIESATEIESEHIFGYTIVGGGGYFNDNNDVRLWSIDDAKRGDVLVDAYGNIGIFDKCYDFDWMSCCSLGNNGGFQHFTVEHENEKTYPATKEQYNLFFSKMKEAGWEWDCEKKELKKIKIVSKEHENNRIRNKLIAMCQHYIECYSLDSYNVDGYKEALTWLKNKALDADKVIMWLRQNTCAACWDNPDEGVSQRIDKFKTDFGL